MLPIRTLIIDDEANARSAIKNMAQQLKLPVEIIGEAGNAAEGLEKIKLLQPELLFLDIQMPGKSGIELMQEMNSDNIQVIFVTAHQGFAIQALKLSAIDYILKPVDPADLKEAVEKAFKQKNKLATEQLLLFQQALQHLQQPQQKAPQKLALSTSEGVLFTELKDIIWIESLTGYCKFYLQGQKPIVVSKNLKEYEDLLATHNFFRTHQSSVVNLMHIKKYVRGEGGQVWMTDGSEIEVARRRKEELLSKMAQINI
ncbi:MAG TPA: LytTR family DNA-binding domain-containing protein [Panacibacter sp.]|nr:LytTR family DNA-binding domain-containing protein [Panacibacter sp.]